MERLVDEVVFVCVIGVGDVISSTISPISPSANAPGRVVHIRCIKMCDIIMHTHDNLMLGIWEMLAMEIWG